MHCTLCNRQEKKQAFWFIQWLGCKLLTYSYKDDNTIIEQIEHKNTCNTSFQHCILYMMYRENYFLNRRLMAYRSFSWSKRSTPHDCVVRWDTGRATDVRLGSTLIFSLNSCSFLWTVRWCQQGDRLIVHPFDCCCIVFCLELLWNFCLEASSFHYFFFFEHEWQSSSRRMDDSNWINPLMEEHFHQVQHH